MQRESIQRYCFPRARVTLIASLKFAGRLEMWIPLVRRSVMLEMVVHQGGGPLGNEPQQWDRAM